MLVLGLLVNDLRIIFYLCLKAKKMHTCENCGFQTSRLSNYKRHLNRKNPCKKKKGVVSSVVLDDLSKRTMKKKIYNCEICGITFANRQNKYRHKKNVKCKPPPEVCQPITGVSGAICEQIKSLPQCEICLKTFRSKQGKYQHKKNVNCKPPPEVCQPIAEVEQRQKIKNNTCTRCGKCFSTKYNLRVHVSKCTGSTNNPLQCEICLKMFATRQNKYRHRKNVKCKPAPEVCQPIAEVEQRQIRELQEEILMLKTRRKGFTEGVKKRVASGQGWKCNMCDCNLPHNYQVDHIQAVSLGGKNDISNAQALCKPCHQMKTKLDVHKLSGLSTKDNQSCSN